jgi:5-methyltetrahydrofolate--homocysteine methyltransferase
MDDLQNLFTAIVEGDAKRAKALTESAVADGADPKTLLDHYMIPAMDEVGRLFESNEYFVPELLISARAMKWSLEVLKPLLSASGAKPMGRVAIGTVKGDLHDIGKNLVAAMLEGGGFEIVDLGVDVGPEQILAAYAEAPVDIVALSALLTTTMPSMRMIVDKLTEAGVRDKVKIMIGGAPVTAEYAQEIGADGYSENASSAVVLARTLVNHG